LLPATNQPTHHHAAARFPCLGHHFFAFFSSLSPPDSVFFSFFFSLSFSLFLPAEDAEDEVEHEEWSDDDERDEEDPVVGAPNGIVRLKERNRKKKIRKGSGRDSPNSYQDFFKIELLVSTTRLFST
jgi:hypothetical protein